MHVHACVCEVGDTGRAALGWASARHTHASRSGAHGVGTSMCAEDAAAGAAVRLSATSSGSRRAGWASPCHMEGRRWHHCATGGGQRLPFAPLLGNRPGITASRTIPLRALLSPSPQPATTNKHTHGCARTLHIRVRGGLAPCAA